MVEVLAGGGLTIVGLLIGRLWDHFTERDRWVRDHKTQAYATFLRAAEAVFQEMSLEMPQFDRARLNLGVAELSKAGAMIEIIGSEPVDRAAHKVWNELALRIRDDDLEAMTDEEWGPVSERLRDLINTFRDASRADLKSKAIAGRTDPPGITR